jgi:caffeoyl-CoA O-methyltransferase
MNNLLLVRDNLGSLAQERFWRIGEKTGVFLQSLLSLKAAKSVLEIGTSSGYSALWMLEVLRQTKGHLWTIESHSERFEIASENFKKAKVEKYVTQIKGHAPEAIVSLPEELNFDFVFIDATKAETKLHFEASFNRLNPGGIIVIDNIATHREKFEDFFSFLNERGIAYEEKDIEAGLLIVHF